MQYILYLLSIPFLYLNYKIIASDIQRQIIPNKYLGGLICLIPFYYIWFFFQDYDISYIGFVSQIIITLVIGIILYIYKIWAAGDVKYIVILGCYIPHTGIIPFIGNIGLTIIIFLLTYFIWFWVGKHIFYQKHVSHLYKNICIDIQDRWKNFKANQQKSQKSLRKTIGIWLIQFIIFFITLRLARIYIFQDIYNNNPELIGNMLGTYHYYLIFGIIGCILGALYIYKKIVCYIQKKIQNSDYKKYLSIIFWCLMCTGLISFIVYEIQYHPENISQNLYNIFTVYFIIYIIFILLKYAYKITFCVGEQSYINIDDLQVGMIIDTTSLYKKIGNQHCIRGVTDNNTKKFIDTLPYTLTDEYVEKIQYIYARIHKNHTKRKTPGYEENKYIKINHSFAFGPYIAIGWCITFCCGSSFIGYILKGIFGYIFR